MALDEARAVQHVGTQLRLVQLRLQGAPVVVVAGVAAERREPVRCEGEEAFQRRTPRHILDIRVEPAVLVDHEHRRPRALSRRVHQIAAHRRTVAARRRIRDVLGLDAWIGEGDGLRPGVVGHKAVRKDQPRKAQGRGAVEKFAPVDTAMAVLVVEAIDLLVDLDLGNRVHRASIGRFPEW